MRLLICIIMWLLTLIGFDIKAQEPGKLFPKEEIRHKTNKLFLNLEKDTVKNLIKFSPFPFGYRAASGSYERFLGSRSSVTVGISATGFSLYRIGGYGSYFSADVGMRYYLNKKKSPMEGMYFSPQLTIAHSFRYFDFNRYSTSIGANLLIGKQVISKNGFVLDLFTGLGMSYTNSSFSPKLFGGPNIHIPTGINIGFGW